MLKKYYKNYKKNNDLNKNIDNVENILHQLGYKLPISFTKVSNYASLIKVEKMIYVSGQLPFQNGTLLKQGKVCSVDSMSKQEINSKYNTNLIYDSLAKKLVIVCILNILGLIKKKILSLNKITKIIKLSGYISSHPNFFGQADVMNEGSNLLIKCFGEKIGSHTRIAIGAVSLPLNSPVEIEMLVKC